LIHEVYDPDDLDGGEGRLAFVVPAALADPTDRPLVEFFTPPSDPQQVALIRYPVGHVVAPHVHREHVRFVARTVEVLVVRRGSMALRVYSSRGTLAAELTLLVGDVAVLLAGGHGLTALADLELLEVKNGPYAGSRAKDKREL
jgi:hypothetical protein